MTIQDIIFTSEGHRLAGTLTTPDTPGPHPAALLVTGSGPIDRDSNMRRQSLWVTKHLADQLAGHGIATLRYDKRGVGASEGDYHATGFLDNVSDAAAALTALRLESAPSSAFVVGHSEGALIATRLAATRSDLDGAVLLAGSARNGEAVLHHQAAIAHETLPGFVRLIMKLFRTDIHKVQAKRLEQLKATSADATRIQMVKINAKWFREFMAYDPADDLPRVSIPLLAITGEKDLQVPAEDVDVMQRLAAGQVEAHRPPQLTHILRNDPHPASLKAYRKLMRQPTDADLMDLVAAWIERVSASESRAGSAGS